MEALSAAVRTDFPARRVARASVAGLALWAMRSNTTCGSLEPGYHGFSAEFLQQPRARTLTDRSRFCWRADVRRDELYTDGGVSGARASRLLTAVTAVDPMERRLQGSCIGHLARVRIALEASK